MYNEFHFLRIFVTNVTLYTKDFESSGLTVRMLVKVELGQKPLNPFNEVK